MGQETPSPFCNASARVWHIPRVSRNIHMTTNEGNSDDCEEKEEVKKREWLGESKAHDVHPFFASRVIFVKNTQLFVAFWGKASSRSRSAREKRSAPRRIPVDTLIIARTFICDAKPDLAGKTISALDVYISVITVASANIPDGHKMVTRYPSPIPCNIFTVGSFTQKRQITVWCYETHRPRCFQNGIRNTSVDGWAVCGTENKMPHIFRKITLQLWQKLTQEKLE